MAKYFKYWGKTDRDDPCKYHLLPYHCLDVAAVGKTLLESHKLLRIRLSSALHMNEKDLIQLICFFLSIHDIGKFAEVFQNKQPDLREKLYRTNLQNMRVFYLRYSNCDALRRELSWTHYRLLLRLEKPEARVFYEAEAVNSRWSTRELERQINSLLFERLALSRDKAAVLELAQKGHEIQQPTDLVKDPYVLEFTGIKQNERFLEKDLETALIDKLR